MAREDRASLHVAYHTLSGSLDADYRESASLDHELLLHTLDGGFGSGQFKNAAEFTDLQLVCVS
jgi:hypothetical protein